MYYSSIIRRHYTLAHTKTLRGDAVWMIKQKHAIDSKYPLFLKRGASYKQDDALSDRHHIMHNELFEERLNRILTYVHEHGRDPIGIWEHFKSWEDAFASNLLQPIIFVSLPLLSSNSKVAAALRKFLKRRNDFNILTYKPKKYSQYTFYRNVSVSQFYEPRKAGSRTLAKILNGTVVLQKMSQYIDNFIVNRAVVSEKSFSSQARRNSNRFDETSIL